MVSEHGNNFLKTMLRLSKTRDSLKVVDDQFGGPTGANDIANVCISIAKQLIKDPSKSGIYHYSGQPDISWCQFANTIFEQAGRKTIAIPVLSSQYPTLAFRPSNSRLDCSVIQDVFGISRPYWYDSLAQIIKDLESKHDKA